ncbi:MAG TPA: PQQ-binding-like beta-propeller repeat protein [Candidatus Limnocylindria bacterium]|nr:PQQ-binding-like beta-propeller repeat protein [Candidatus Limnocylindria bacterium]
MNREQLRRELPEPVRRYFEEVARMEPPVDLLSAAITKVESEPRVNRFSLLPAMVAVAATAVIAAVIAFNVFGLKVGPFVGDDASPTPQGSPTMQTMPPLEGLPSAGTIEQRYSIPADAGFPALEAHGSVWLSNGETGVVTRIDAETGQITAQIDVNPNPETDRYDQNLVADESYVWATGADRTLVQIDPATNAVLERFDISVLIYRMVVSGDDIWISDLNDTNSVIRFSTTAGEVTLRRPMTNWPGGLAVAENGDVWVTPYQADDLLRLDPETGDQLESNTVRSFGMQILLFGDALYISGNQGRPLERFSIPDGRVTARFSQETRPELFNGRLYGLEGEALIVLDAATLQVVAALDMGPNLGGLLAGSDSLWIVQGTEILKVRPA